MLVCPKLTESYFASNSSYRGGISHIAHKYAKVKSTSILTVKTLERMCRAIYPSNPNDRLPLSDDDIRYFSDRHPEVYIFILTVTAYRSRDTYPLDGYRDAFKRAFRNCIIDYEASLNRHPLPLSDHQLPSFLFNAIITIHKMDDAFLSQVIAFWTDILCELCNDGVGYSLLFIHGLYFIPYATTEKTNRFGTYLLYSPSEDRDSKYVSKDFNDDLCYINPENIMAFLYMIMVCSLTKPQLMTHFSGAVVAWLRHLMGRSDGIEILAQPEALSFFFKPSPHLPVRELLSELTESTSDDPEKSKVVRRHFNYLKLKHSNF